jgi:hypothetical protein
MNKKVFTIVITLFLVLSLCPTGIIQGRGNDSAVAYNLVAQPNIVENKIHADLLSDIQNALPGDNLQFVARIVPGTDLGNYCTQWFARPFIDPLGSTVAAGFAKPTAMLKMAADPGVIWLQRSEALIEAPILEDPDLENNLNRDIAPKINTDEDASPGPAPEGWYSTTGAIHGSQEAWAKGYTGEGVRLMINDSGADYCHPDLLGTWAYIDDPLSPYYGLPEMFDSYSSYMAAYDYYVGTSRIASGFADYADTSATATGNFTYQPIGANVTHNYSIPDTSLSSVYHYGSHPDKALALNADVLSAFFGDGTAVAGERAAILVVDENTAGVYDTVYVDLNYNYDFTDDAPARLTRDFTYQETAALDYDYDGLNDVSGGLVYFISDGATAVPTLDWFWGIPGSFFGNGDLVAFHVQDFTEAAGTHGQGTTSVAVGQGVVVGSLVWGPTGYPIADYNGLVVGPGKDVASTQNGNSYVSPFVEDAFYYAGLGYDGIPGTGDDVQIVSDSWGYSDVDNDGFDYDSRLIDSINRAYAPNTAVLFSTGNGAAGYGTVAPPCPPSGIGVGASTLYGSVGLFEPIASADQIVGGDIMPWSNRGPGIRNIAGADVVATGAWGTGDLSLNEVLWGAIATDYFGGTSMSAPVAAGNLALLYQAWFDRTGSWPTFDEARTLLMSTARNTEHDVWTQGSGLVDADIGTDVAAGLAGIYVTPGQWSVGDYRGEEYEAFTHIIGPGETDVQTFTINNTGDKKIRVDLSSATLKLVNTEDYSFTTLNQSLDHGDNITLMATPDYVFRIDPDIPRKTDLLMVRVANPHEQFDPDEDLSEPFSRWIVSLQNWTDLNEDGKFWEDINGNTKVDVGEMEQDEYIRFTYGYNVGPTQQVRIANPVERMADGILLALQHRSRTEEVPTTDLTIEASFWSWHNWDWLQVGKKKLNVPAGGSAEFDATLRVPPNTPYGMYEGEIIAKCGDNEVIIPVTVAVAASGSSFSFGETNYQNGKTPVYDNEYVFGYTDYGWRAESGDWRFFWTDIAEDSLPESGTSYLVVDNSWANPGTDIDTIILGPTDDPYSPSSIYGPYTLEPVGQSINTHIGSGRWIFQTSSGGPREIISAPTEGGLHGILLHQVRVDGSVLEEPFHGSVGLVTLDPASIAGNGSGSATVDVASTIDLEGLVAEGFGLGSPVATVENVSQDDPNDPSTASFVTTVDIEHGCLLEVSTANSANGSDIDLYVYDPEGEPVASSTTPTDEEHVSILFPADGNYTIAVHGWSVPSGSDTFELTINAVQGHDVTATAPPDILAGSTGSIDVSWDTSGYAPGTYYGLVLFGISDAPGLFQVPVEITVP